ncbi:TolC family protein [soil metagenome]
MSNFRSFLLLIFAVLHSFLVFSQTGSRQSESLTLSEIIDYAKNYSPVALQAETRKENRYWQWRTYLSNYNPQLSVRGRFPEFNRTVLAAQQPDGTIRFQPVTNNIIDMNLRLSQSIGATGGMIFLNSQVQRFDDLDRDFTQFSGNPAILGFVQPLFGFNRLKWDKRIEPLRYEESRKGFQEDMEEIGVNATQLFFDLLLAQVNFEIASKNLANNDTIFKIGEGRYNLGKIAENDLLQLELNLLKSRQDVSQAELDLETSTLRLKTYIGWTDEARINLFLPDIIPTFEVDEEVAIREARKNRADAVAFKRQVLQAQRDVAQARGENGLNIDVFGTVGLTNRGNTINDIYVNPNDQQSLSIGFEIPIIDWGRQKSVRRTSQANQKLVEYTVAQDEINFDQQIYTQVKQFKMLRDQLLITSKADEISLNRYEIAKNRYLIGKISITDLNIALQDKDLAKRAYISSLRNFWTSYYDLRVLTLYDFDLEKGLFSE